MLAPYEAQAAPNAGLRARRRVSENIKLPRAAYERVARMPRQADPYTPNPGTPGNFAPATISSKVPLGISSPATQKSIGAGSIHSVAGVVLASLMSHVCHGKGTMCTRCSQQNTYFATRSHPTDTPELKSLEGETETQIVPYPELRVNGLTKVVDQSCFRLPHHSDASNRLHRHGSLYIGRSRFKNRIPVMYRLPRMLAMDSPKNKHNILQP